MALATRLLPVPLSPWMRTLASLGAIRRTVARSEAMAGLWPIMMGAGSRWATMRRRVTVAFDQDLKPKITSELKTPGIIQSAELKAELDDLQAEVNTYLDRRSEEH